MFRLSYGRGGLMSNNLGLSICSLGRFSIWYLSDSRIPCG